MAGRTRWAVAVWLTMAVATACTETQDGRAPGAADASSAQPSTVVVVGAADLDPGSFSDPTTVDNAWFPLVPGTHWVWTGHALDEGDPIRRRVEFTVTDMTKEIGGVPTVVMYDLDYNDGELAESELAFFAQDDGGNVWLFGEYPEEYEEGELVKAPAWIHGFQGARAGLTMKASPADDPRAYAQGWGPKVGWDDRAQVDAVGTVTRTPTDRYEDVLVMREFSKSEPGASQLKYYARGVGNIRVGWRGPNEEEREVLVLTRFERLSPQEMDAIRDAVLAQEARAYEQSPGAYGPTAPMQPRAA